MVKFLINRPIATLMTALAVSILGIVSIGRVPISLMPDIDIPEISIQVDGKNMSARELEDAVIRPLRSNLLRTNHLEDIKSETSNGSSIIRLRFAHGTPIDYSFIEVNEKVDRAMASLPRDLERPRVIKASASDIPVLYLNLILLDGPDTRPNGEPTQRFIDFNRFADQVIRKRIEQLQEVAMVDVTGLVRTELIVVPDKQKLVALGLGLGDIESAIKKEDLEIGSISVKDSQYQYNLRLGNDLDNVRDLGAIYIRKDDRIFQLRELAEIRERLQDRKGSVLYNGREAVAMAIIKQSGTRMGRLKDVLGEIISQMEGDYPEIEFSIIRDQTKLLDHAIGNLGQSLFWGVLLAFTVMLLFLRDLKSPLLIGIGIPVSLVVCLLLFHLLGISINIISLSGLILGIGLMIDNSIIVIDNISQHVERGHSLSEACAKGTNEVFRPLLSSVLTTCAVFVPLIFLSGVTGALFYDQAMAITIGLFVSLVVSITLLPVLYHLLHFRKGRLHSLGRSLEKWDSQRYVTLYEKGFQGVMRNQTWAFASFGAMALITVGLFIFLPKSQMPGLTSTEAMMSVDWNEPIHISENKERVLDLAHTVTDSIKEYSALVGRQQFLLDKDTSSKTSETEIYVRTSNENGLIDIKTSMSQYLSRKYPNAVVSFTEVDNIFNLIFSNGSAPLTARLQKIGYKGNKGNEKLRALWSSIQQDIPGTDIPPIAWEDNVVLIADLEKLATYGISPSLFENTLKSAFNQTEVISIADNQDLVPVILGNEKQTIAQVLEQAMVRANDSTYYNVGDFIRESHVKNLGTITAGREGEYYPIDFFIPTHREKEVVNMVKDIVGRDTGHDVQFTGSIQDGRKLVGELAMVLGVTLLLLYFILASQFESLSLPFIILLEVPVAMAGAFMLLAVFGMGINLMSMIGVVVMSGIIINDSILKMDTIIQLQRKGNSLIRSLLVAGQRRLKPILMTSLTTILALVPILLTGGLGGELQAPLAVALIGGMLVGTLVSLYFVPLCYYLLVKKKSHAM